MNNYITLPRAVVEQKIREAGGIVHSDGNIFFTNAEVFLRAALVAPQPAPPGYKLVPVTYENDLRQAAKHALEALGSLQGGCTDSNDGTVEAITVWCPEVIAELAKALAAAPDLRPKAPEATPVPASDTKDHQLEHLVTREDVEPLITEGKARYLWSKAHDDTTDRMAFQVFAQLVAAHVAQKLKGAA